LRPQTDDEARLKEWTLNAAFLEGGYVSIFDIGNRKLGLYGGARVTDNWFPTVRNEKIIQSKRSRAKLVISYKALYVIIGLFLTCVGGCFLLACICHCKK